MKKVNLAVTAALSLMAIALTSCTVEETKKYEGTKLVVSQWPENVSSIRVLPKEGTKILSLSEAGSMMTNEYFSGEAQLIVTYNRITNEEYDEYFGYGIRSDSDNQFKVFINGEEAENTNPAEVKQLYNNDEEVTLNANINQYRSTFDITNVKTVELTFENAPEKISNKDIRIEDDFQWAYIDTDDLNKDFQTVSLYINNSSNINKELDRICKNGLYVFDAYGQTFDVYLAVKNNYYSTVEDIRFTVTENGVINENAELTVEDVYDQYVGSFFKCEVYLNQTRISDGTIIKLSGSKVTAHDTSNFSNKTLTFAENIDGNTEITAASLILKGDAASGTSFSLNIDGEEWAGTWYVRKIKDFTEPRIDLNSHIKAGSNITYQNIELIYHESGLNICCFYSAASV